jgi:hypothetical protein
MKGKMYKLNFEIPPIYLLKNEPKRKPINIEINPKNKRIK